MTDPNPSLSPPRRKALGVLLKSFLPVGKGQVYFQDPGDPALVYPAIIYKLDDILTQHANNEPYFQEKAWLVTLIDRDPDSEIAEKIARMRKCNFVDFMVVKGLNHTIYQLHF